ncbi:UbiD family decarboxylase domain-containing protein [Neorhizobium sp. Rsf11]|uniref:UbiD family decarboxylase domain-containing protein n=2 Tax=Neorhizobium TaxID=1525371 RepID=A0ABV0MCJ5_9HYPH|nr:UbiD family decarboxylase domain-containing protein [Neorhizobium petrolearium]MCC2613708.1 UbiD family decarboxylase [Neorhizobium petrolearium]WGI72022.1 UbiD family decarboxylase [Neorhizobium petrolearium]
MTSARMKRGGMKIFAHSAARKAPATLFDNFPGYAPGMRIVSGIHNSTRRLAYTLGLPSTDSQMELVKSYRARTNSEFKFMPPAR